MEVRMARDAASNRSEVRPFAFGSYLVPVFALICLSLCAILLLGCNSSASRQAELDRIRETPAAQRKAELLKLLDRKFENPDAHFELGELYRAEGLWPKAEYHYNVALGFDPAHREAQAAMVNLFLESGETAKSKTYADIYMNQVASSASQALRLGLAFQKQLLDEYALACYQQALSLAPNSAKIHRQIGYYYLSKNDKVRATEYLSRSFQLDPKQPEVAGELGRLGVEVRIPRKTETNTKKLDKIVEQSGKESK
jgi:tetratricopeptide (TPR) repeat protein